MAKGLLGTCDEAIGFLTLPTNKRTAWTYVEALTEACRSMLGIASLDEIAGTERELRVSQTLTGIEFSYPIPPEYECSWRDWLHAFLANDPQIEILLLEEAIITHQVPAEARSDIDPSIITSAMS